MKSTVPMRNIEYDTGRQLFQGFTVCSPSDSDLGFEDGLMDNQRLDDIMFYLDGGKSYKAEIEFAAPIDISQVAAVWVGSERFPTE